MTNILVTGGLGFIGSNFVRLALSKGHRVLNFDAVTYAGNPDNLKDLESSSEYEFKKGSITDASAMTSALQSFKPEYVINFAAETHVDRSIDSPAAFIHTNVVGAYTLFNTTLEHFRALPDNEKKSFRVIHISTDEVYGSVEEGASKEDDVYEPNSPYSASKAGADHLARAFFKTYGLPIMVTNCTNNYGPYHFPEKLIPLAITNALEGKNIPIYGDGLQMRDWLYVEDHCSAILEVAKKGRLGEKYNIGSKNQLTNLEVIQSICNALDELKPRADKKSYASLTTHVTDRPGHDRRYALDIEKIHRELGWSPSVHFAEGIRKTIQWYLENTDWWTKIKNQTYAGQRLGVAK